MVHRVQKVTLPLIIKIDKLQNSGLSTSEAAEYIGISKNSVQTYYRIIKELKNSEPISVDDSFYSINAV